MKRFGLALQIESANLLLLNCIQVFSEDAYLTTFLLTYESVLIYRLERGLPTRGHLVVKSAL